MIVALFFIQLNKCLDGSQAIDISKYKSFLSLAKGTIQIKMDGEHDTVSGTAIVKFCKFYQKNEIICFFFF